MLNSRGEPMDKESRRGRRDLGAKNPGGPTAMFLKQEQPRLWPLFQPRPPLKFIGTVTKKKCLPLTGIAAFMEKFEAATSKPAPARVCQETILERKERRQKEKAAAAKKLLQPKIAAYREKQKRFSELRDSAKAKATAEAAAKIAAAVGGGGDGAAAAAASDTGDGDGAEGGTGLPPYMTVDPFCTLFAARLPFDTTESRLRRVFSKWGPVKKVHLVTHRDGAPRGMAFIEFESEKDMRAAYDRADGMKLGRNLDGKDMRILVDVERGRTVRDWLPRRLGGGLGGTRRGSVRVNDRSSGRAGAERERLGLGIASYRGSTSPRGGYGGYSRGSYDRRGFDRPRAFDHRDRDRDRRDRDRDRDRDRTRDRDRRSHSARDDRKDRDRRSHRDDDRKRSRH